MSVEHKYRLTDRPADIAIIGIACRFPGAKNREEYWENLRNGVDSISRFSDDELLAQGVEPELLRNPAYVKANGIIPDIEMFDAAFFGYSPREAKMMDPQHRIFMECVWEAIEDAGYDIERYKGVVGVYGGQGMNTYLIRNVYAGGSPLEALEQFQLMIASDKDYLTTRVSYKFNLTGPSIDVQTSCSTSLVAVHLACLGLNAGECDMALAGGIAVRPPLRVGYLYREGMIFSPDGCCRAFDARAGGTVNGNGVGVVVLKRLEDALRDGDTIHAVIKSTAINNDGAIKGGYTAPSSDGQAGAIALAIARSGVDVETITYVEAHGTATILGDPIEVAGLTKAFRAYTQKKQFCAIGSVKTNVGHTDVAAGMAALIKTVQMLKHGQIPPSLNYESPNPNIDFENSPFYVSTRLAYWHTNGHPRRAGVSSFGVGGTNAHAILEQAPTPGPTSSSREWQLLLLSAKTQTALDSATLNLADHLRANPQITLADAAYTLQVGRRGFNHRRMLVARDVPDALVAMNNLASDRLVTLEVEPRQRQIVFMFPGQGAQYVNMARGLYESEPIFQERVNYCCEALKPHLGLDLHNVLYPPAGQEEEAAYTLTQTAITQPALFVIEYALACLWMAWGIYPDVMVGHSIGEYVAAYLAGVFSLDDALALVAARGRLIQQQPPGTMLAVPLPEAEVKSLLTDDLSLSVINGVSLCVVGGPTQAIDTLEDQLKARSVNCQRLHTSHAFHSAMMQPAVEPFIQIVKQARLNPPKMQYMSNVTGAWVTEQDATDPAYWARHMRHTVRFADNVGELLADAGSVFLEVGPGQTLSTLVRQHPNFGVDHVIVPSVRHPRDQRPDLPFLLSALGRLWLSGVEIDWAGFYACETRRRIPLPTYPFERERFWIDPIQAVGSAQLAAVDETNGASGKAAAPRSASRQATRMSGNKLEQTVLAIWQEIVGVKTVNPNDNFFDLGGSSLMAAGLLAQIEKATGRRIALSAFFQGPTVGNMLRLLSATEQEDVKSYLIPIRRGSRRPFFWAHGTDFANFAKYMSPEQTFYCMPPPGLDGSQPRFADAEEIIVHHVHEIRKVQPRGPYQLGGYCFGGLVAFSVAERFIAQGEEVSLLALIDTDPPDNVQLLRRQSQIGHYIDRLWYHVRYGQLPRTILAKLREAVHERATVAFGEAEARRLVEISQAQDRVFKNYISSGYPGRVAIFECEEYHNRRDDNWHNRWVALARGGCDHHVIPGNHATMLRPPNVQILVDVLNRYLESVPVSPRI